MSIMTPNFSKRYRSAIASMVIALFALPASAEYNPKTGKFLQRDPNETGVFCDPRDGVPSVSATGQYSDSMNVHEYLLSSPFSGTDQTGLTRAFLPDGTWEGIFSDVADALSAAVLTQQRLNSMEWAEDDYGYAIHDYIDSRDPAVEMLHRSYVKAARGFASRTAYAWAATQIHALHAWNEPMDNLGLGDYSSAVADLYNILELDTCFAAGTLVTLADGTQVGIEEIKVGDRVLTRQQNAAPDARTTQGAVTATFERTVQDYLVINTDNDTITVTNEHPFWVMGLGWCSAADLEVGWDLACSNGTATVQSIASEQGTLTVFNIEVDNAHTYFVGNGSIWVHNMCVYQVHHIIPKALWGKQNAKNSDFEWLWDLKKKGVFARENKINKIRLLKNPVHNGSHPAWNDYVGKQLEALDRTMTKAGLNIDQRRSRVMKFTQRLGRSLQLANKTGVSVNKLGSMMSTMGYRGTMRHLTLKYLYRVKSWRPRWLKSIKALK